MVVVTEGGVIAIGARVVEVIRDFCKAHGYYFDSEYRSDSMVGSVCTGIFCSNPYGVLAELSCWLCRLGVEDVQGVLGRMKIDREGEKCVLYFQGLRMGK